MPRFVITPDVGLYLAEREQVVDAEHQLLAPTLFRSQTLSLLYKAVRHEEINEVGAPVDHPMTGEHQTSDGLQNGTTIPSGLGEDRWGCREL